MFLFGWPVCLVACPKTIAPTPDRGEQAKKVKRRRSVVGRNLCKKVIWSKGHLGERTQSGTYIRTYSPKGMLIKKVVVIYPEPD